MSSESTWYNHVLACPSCGDKRLSDISNKCVTCGFAPVPGTPPDFRSATSRTEQVVHSRFAGAYFDSELSGIDLEVPEIAYHGPSAIRNSAAILSAMMASLSGDDIRLLDLGCGPRDQKVPIEYLGWKYVGVDYFHQNADLLADAHCLPFQDNSFSAVLAYSVLQHLYDPYLALSEIRRVLEPEGIFCGTVAFGEPFQSSFAHLSPWGVMSVLRSSGFKLLQMWPTYDTLIALGRIGRYPRAIRMLLRLVASIDRNMPFLGPRSMQWSPRRKRVEQLFKAGGIVFLAKKNSTDR